MRVQLPLREPIQQTAYRTRQTAEEEEGHLQGGALFCCLRSAFSMDSWRNRQTRLAQNEDVGGSTPSESTNHSLREGRRSRLACLISTQAPCDSESRNQILRRHGEAAPHLFREQEEAQCKSGVSDQTSLRNADCGLKRGIRNWLFPA